MLGCIAIVQARLLGVILFHYTYVFTDPLASCRLQQTQRHQ